MKAIIKTDHKPITICIKVKTFEEAPMAIEAYDQEFNKTYFLTRDRTFKGDFVFKIMLPISPKKLVVNIYNKAKGNLPKGQDKSFTVAKIYSERLQRRMQAIPLNKYNMKEFIDFASRFCYNLSYMEPGLYKSDNGNFKIELLPTITDDSSGRKLNTPARVNKATGKIQISKSDFDGYTVPQRMALLCHEMSHFYINHIPDDESEADLNGLTIYLALGFPRIEAYDAFLDVFDGAPTDQNKQRYDLIDNFIKNFDKQNIILS